MSEDISIRTSQPSDLDALEDLYPKAFPDEDLLPLIRTLLDGAHDVLSLIAVRDAVPVGHAVFTSCGITGSSDKAGLLGPVAVAPQHQRQGIGGALIREGLARLQNTGFRQVLVLGDPAYYSRFGFAPDRTIEPPYQLPEEWRAAWQSLALNRDLPPLEGELVVPAPWRHKSLWSE